MTNISRATRRLAVTGASTRNTQSVSPPGRARRGRADLPASGEDSSRNTGPPLVDGLDLHFARSCHGGLEQCSCRIERGQAWDAPLDRGAPDLEAILEDRAACFFWLAVDIRHGVDDEVDLSLRDDIEHVRRFLANLRHHTRREACPLKRLRGTLGRDQRPPHLDQTRHDGKELRFVGVGDSEKRGSTSRDRHTRRGEGLAQSFVQRARYAYDLPGGLHLGTEVRVDCRQLVHREHWSLDGDEVARGDEARGPTHVDELLAEHYASGELDHGHSSDLGEKRDSARCAGVDLEHVYVAPVHYVLDVHQAAQAEMPCDFHRVLDYVIELGLLQALRGVNRVRITGVHTGTLDVLHDPGDDDCVAIGNGVDLDLDPLQVLVHQHGATRHGADRPEHVAAQLLTVADDLHRPASEDVGRTHQHGVARALRDPYRFLDGGGGAADRLRDADCVKSLGEGAPV